MADIWIVSGYKFTPHYTREVAEKEAGRLREKTGRDFRVYRIKTSIAPGNSAAVINELRSVLADILRYRRGEEPYNFWRLPGADREMAALEAWEALELRMESALAQAGEARRAETALAGSVHEHAVPVGDAP